MKNTYSTSAAQAASDAADAAIVTRNASYANIFAARDSAYKAVADLAAIILSTSGATDHCTYLAYANETIKFAVQSGIKVVDATFSETTHAANEAFAAANARFSKKRNP